LPLAKIVRRCLEKKPSGRFHSASDLAFALEALSTPSGSQNTAAVLPLAPTSQTVLARFRLFASSRIAWIAAAIFFVALLGALPFVVAYFQRSSAEVRAVRFFITEPEKSSFSRTEAPISPDGRHLAFVATTADGKQLLWVR